MSWSPRFRKSGQISVAFQIQNEVAASHRDFVRCDQAGYLNLKQQPDEMGLASVGLFNLGADLDQLGTIMTLGRS